MGHSMQRHAGADGESPAHVVLHARDGAVVLLAQLDDAVGLQHDLVVVPRLVVGLRAASTHTRAFIRTQMYSMLQSPPVKAKGAHGIPAAVGRSQRG